MTAVKTPITVRVAWHGALYYMHVTPDSCVVRVLYPHGEGDAVHPRTIPADVVCQALRELHAKLSAEN